MLVELSWFKMYRQIEVACQLKQSDLAQNYANETVLWLFARLRV